MSVVIVLCATSEWWSVWVIQWWVPFTSLTDRFITFVDSVVHRASYYAQCVRYNMYICLWHCIRLSCVRCNDVIYVHSGNTTYKAALWMTYMVYMLYFPAQCMSCTSSSTLWCTFWISVTSLSYILRYQCTIHRLNNVLNYCSMVHNYSSRVVNHRWFCCPRRDLTGVGIVAPLPGHLCELIYFI